MADRPIKTNAEIIEEATKILGVENMQAITVVVATALLNLVASVSTDLMHTIDVATWQLQDRIQLGGPGLGIKKVDKTIAQP